MVNCHRRSIADFIQKGKMKCPTRLLRAGGRAGQEGATQVDFPGGQSLIDPSLSGGGVGGAYRRAVPRAWEGEREDPNNGRVNSTTYPPKNGGTSPARLEKRGLKA